MSSRPVVLIILDGWGLTEEQAGNAIFLAHTPVFDALQKNYPYSVLKASGKAVGLPEGQMGNSEVGHLNMGAGRLVYQELTRINRAIQTGEFRQNPVLKQALAEKGALHLLGLLSDGGVHSHLTHLFALLDWAREEGLSEIYLHLILDGRDVPPLSAGKYIAQLEKKLAELGVGVIATLAGRYYTMDRDQRWERVALAYQAMVNGVGPKARSPEEALRQAYEAKLTDEFVKPVVCVDQWGQPRGLIKPQDVVLMYNFRADRARQISYAFTEEDFTGFVRPGGWLKPSYVCLTQYDLKIKAPVAFPPQDLRNILGEVVSRAGLKQLRIAETEKYAHVTFFFNGGLEKPYPGEKRILIPSPEVPTYNLQPEMSAEQITKQVVEKIKEATYDLIIMNYANPDMVGHTGHLPASIKAIEKVDSCLQKVLQAVLEQGGAALVTADHGNAEQMWAPLGQKPHTAHTANPVPCLLVADGLADVQLRNGSLADIAPTLLELLNLTQPAEMTGKSLLVRKGGQK